MRLFKEFGWIAALALAGYVGWLTITPYTRAIAAHDAALAQWGSCIKANPDRSLSWTCELKTPPTATAAVDPPKDTVKK